MGVFVYEIRSGLSQIPRAHSAAFLSAVEAALGETLTQASLQPFLEESFGLIYVSSGGSEGLFLQQFSSYDKPCYLLTSGDSNSLAASMEILAYLRQTGERARYCTETCNRSPRAFAFFPRRARKAGADGASHRRRRQPSDWLIASTLDRAACAENSA
jgi:hypothetical protein